MSTTRLYMGMENFPKWLQKPSYTDNWLLDFHNSAQTEKQSTSNRLEPWNQDILADERMTQQAWKDAFDLNGFADYTSPMMTQGMTCLVVGSDDDHDDRHDDDMPSKRRRPRQPRKLPWEDVGDDHNEEKVEGGIEITSLRSATNPPPPSSLSSTPHNAEATSSSLDTSRPIAATYDCIFDQGLFQSVLEAIENDDDSDNDDNTSKRMIQQLLTEAATALKEHGIYVWVLTDNPRLLTPQLQGILKELTPIVGLEWEFSLDGISSSASNNENDDDGDDTEGQVVVSVARRFCTGPLPPVGKLSRYQA